MCVIPYHTQHLQFRFFCCVFCSLHTTIRHSKQILMDKKFKTNNKILNFCSASEPISSLNDNLHFKVFVLKESVSVMLDNKAYTSGTNGNIFSYLNEALYYYLFIYHQFILCRTFLLFCCSS